MVVAMMGGDEKKRTFHDFLGMSGGDSSPPAAAWAQSGLKTSAVEAAPEASASLGVSSVGHGLVSGSSDLGSGKFALVLICVLGVGFLFLWILGFMPAVVCCCFCWSCFLLSRFVLFGWFCILS